MNILFDKYKNNAIKINKLYRTVFVLLLKKCSIINEVYVCHFLMVDQKPLCIHCDDCSHFSTRSKYYMISGEEGQVFCVTVFCCSTSTCYG